MIMLGYKCDQLIIFFLKKVMKLVTFQTVKVSKSGQTSSMLVYSPFAFLASGNNYTNDGSAICSLFSELSKQGPYPFPVLTHRLSLAFNTILASTFTGKKS